MGFISVIVAAIANFAFGAVWYMSLSKPWMEASGVEVGEDGQPANNSDPIPYITSFIAAILVAGMMRHVFVLSGIDTFGKGLMSGLGIGLFLVTPWIATFYGFGGKPRKLVLIDGGYATIGCTIIGAVLTLF
jgi:hypothetical protein